MQFRGWPEWWINNADDVTRPFLEPGNPPVCWDCSMDAGGRGWRPVTLHQFLLYIKINALSWQVGL